MLGLLYLALPAGVLFALYLLDRPYAVPESFRVTETEWIRSLSETPPSGRWTSTAAERPEGRRDGEPFSSIWYRVNIPSDVDDPTLLIVYGYANFDIWHDSRRIFRTGEASRPLFYAKRSIVVPLGRGRLETNEPVYIRTTIQSSSTGIRYLYIAPLSLATRNAAELDFNRFTIPSFILAVMLSLAAAVGTIYLFRRSDAAYGWFTATAMLWAARTAHTILVEQVPFHSFLWFASGYLFLNWLVAELLFINRYFDIPAPRLEKWVAGISAVLCSIMLLIAWQALESRQFEAYYYAFFLPVNLWYLLIGFIITARYFVAIRKRMDFDSVSLWLASGIVIVAGLRDILYELGLGVPGTTYYLHYVGVIPLILFAIQLMRRFARNARTAEMRNEELNAMVEQRSVALEQTYQRLNEETRRRALAEERSRLMRDMHDGLGGQLVHALALSEEGQDKDLQHSLQMALDDLRLIVDSLSPSADSLDDLLASYRHRVSRPLERTGFEVRWEISEGAEATNLKPNEALSVLRIIQEAVTNAVRHSGGDRITIRVGSEEARLTLCVEDNGTGIAEAVVERGLRNMRVRANELQAKLTVESQPGRTQVAVDIPLT